MTWKPGVGTYTNANPEVQKNCCEATAQSSYLT